MAINTLPVQFERNFKGSFIIGEIFTSLTDLNNWLTNPTRYAGQRAVLVDSVGGTVTEYVLNEAEDAWLPSGSGGSGGGISLWTASTVYAIDDVIIEPTTLNIYICTFNHTSDATDFFNDLANWDEVSKRDVEKWETSKAYAIGDIVVDTVGLKIYSCNTAHTSDATAFANDLANWNEISQKGLKEWTASTAYVIGDNVIDPVSLQIYKCNTAHTSDATAIANDIVNWDKVSKPDSTDGDIAVFEGTAKEFNLGGEIFETMSTGVESFAGLAINASTTTFDVGATTGHIIDIAGDTYYEINFAGQTNIAPSVVNGVTYVLIDNTSSVSLQTTLPTPNDRRTKMFLGRVVTVGGTVVQVQDTPSVFLESTNQTYDLADAIRIFNIEGNILSPNGTNLNINKTPGKIFSVGANFTSDPLNPHQISIGGATPASFAYITRAAGSTGTTTSAIDPNSYDAAGVVTTIPGSNSQATIQRVYLFPSGNIRIAYGQTVYSNLAEALQNVSIEGFVENPNIAGNGILIGFVVVKKNATDLSSSSQARVLLASRFGEGSIGAAGVSVSTMQNTYDNSNQPQITVNGTQGGVQVRDASTPIADSLLQIQDNAGTTNYLDVKASHVEVTDADGTQVIRKDYEEIHREDFKVNDDTDAGVTLTGTGTLGMETVSPISGWRSLKYTQDVGGSAGAFLDLSSIPVEDDVPGNLVGLLLDLKGSAELVDGYKVSLYESADDATYTEVQSVTVTAKTVNTPVQVSGQILSTSLYLGLRVEALVGSASHEILIDNILFRTRPLPIVNFNNIKEGVEYTPTIGATNTVTDNKAFYYDRGDKTQITGYASFSSSGTGNLTFTMPSGKLIDTAKLPTTNSAFAKLGEARWYDASGASTVKLWVCYNADDLFFFKQANGAAFGGVNIDNGDTLYFDFEVPIQNQPAQGSGVVNQGQSTPYETKVLSSNFTSLGIISDLSFTGLTIGNDYDLNLNLNMARLNTTSNSKDIQIRINGTDVGTNIPVQFDPTTNEFFNISFSKRVKATATTISVEVLSLNNLQVGSGSDRTYFQVIPVNNPTVISPLKTEITTGTEYLTGEVIDNKPVYARRFSVGTTITTTTVIATIDTGLTLLNGWRLSAAGNWVIYDAPNYADAGTGTGEILTQYKTATGEIEIFINGMTVAAGTAVKIEYTK